MHGGRCSGGRFIPVVPKTLGKLEIDGISIPIAIFIWGDDLSHDDEGGLSKHQAGR